MAAKTRPQVQEDVSPNLIPMVDIMFLLLLFFMLGADMGQRELEAVELPKAENVGKDDPSKSRRLTVNVYHKYGTECAAYAAREICREEKHWLVGIRGLNYATPQELKAKLAQEAPPEAGTRISERKVMIRADESAPYGLVQRVMNECAGVGIYKIEVGAARSKDGR